MRIFYCDITLGFKLEIINIIELIKKLIKKIVNFLISYILDFLPSMPDWFKNLFGFSSDEISETKNKKKEEKIKKEYEEKK